MACNSLGCPHLFLIKKKIKMIMDKLMWRNTAAECWNYGPLESGLRSFQPIIFFWRDFFFFKKKNLGLIQVSYTVGTNCLEPTLEGKIDWVWP